MPAVVACGAVRRSIAVSVSRPVSVSFERLGASVVVPPGRGPLRMLIATGPFGVNWTPVSNVTPGQRMRGWAAAGAASTSANSPVARRRRTIGPIQGRRAPWGGCQPLQDPHIALCRGFSRRRVGASTIVRCAARPSPQPSWRPSLGVVARCGRARRTRLRRAAARRRDSTDRYPDGVRRSIRRSCRSTLHRSARQHDPIPILMYHVDRRPAGGRPLSGALRLRRRTSPGQIAWLARHGFHAVTLQDVVRPLAHRPQPPDPPDRVTFDDGYHSQFATAAPILHGHGWPGVLDLEVRNTERLVGAVASSRSGF